MFRLIRIVFNACLLVLAFIGFNAIGGEKYIEQAKVFISNYIQEYQADNLRSIGDFSGLNKEFQIDNSVNLMGYKAIIAEHSASSQKMIILDSGKKPLLTEEDITNSTVEEKIKTLSNKFKYQGVSVNELKITGKGFLTVYGQKVPYVKFEGKVTKLPFSDISGIVAGVKTSDNSYKIALSVNEKKKYSQLITDEFFKGVEQNRGK